MQNCEAGVVLHFVKFAHQQIGGSTEEIGLLRAACDRGCEYTFMSTFLFHQS